MLLLILFAIIHLFAHDRKLERLKFRTTDTQLKLEFLLEIISLRVAIHKLIKNGIILKARNLRGIFYKVCETVVVEKEVMEEDLKILVKSVDLIEQ